MHRKTNISAHPLLRPHHLHGIRTGLMGLLLVALLLGRADLRLSAAEPAARSGDHGAVLAYATSMSRSDLLSETNTARATNGLGTLAENSQLDSSAQAKAQHMIDHDYWAHVAPDGTQPWYFFDQAGYDYQTAGENLAYGFATSAGVLTAWMNSTSHRANVLGSYADVGFGIADGANYQGGLYTVVVAHYGLPPGGSPSSPAAPTQPPAPTTPDAPAPAAAPTQPVPAETPAETTVVAPAPTETAPTTAPEAAPTPPPSPQAVAQTTSKNISALEGLRLGVVPLTISLSLGLTTLAAAAFAFTHRALMKHAVLAGEQFVIAHPALDVSLVAAVVALLLSTTVARI